LGLSLAAAVARMHGGTVELEDNQPGLRVRLTLPAAADDRPQARTPADLVFNDRNAR
jgi:signal transduction histidine kinase